MPPSTSRHSHSNSRSSIVAPAHAGFTHQSRTSSQTSLVSAIGTGHARVNSGLTFTAVNKKRGDKTIGLYPAPQKSKLQTQQPIHRPTREGNVGANSTSRRQRSQGDARKPMEDVDIAQGGEEEDWVSSSGAETTSSVEDDDDKEEEEEEKTERLEEKIIDIECVGTPKAGLDAREVVISDVTTTTNPPPPPMTPKPSLLRQDTELTLLPTEHIAPLTPISQTDASNPKLKSTAPTTISSTRSQPDPHRSRSISPRRPPLPQRSMTRPPSIRSISSNRTATRPHPLIRGHSFSIQALNGHPPTPQHESPLGLTAITAPPIITADVASPTHESPTGFSPPPSLTGRRTSQSSVRSVATLPTPDSTHAGGSAAIYGYTASPQDNNRDARDRTISLTRSSTTVPLNTALSTLTRHHPPHAPLHAHNRNSWHFPAFPILPGLNMTPAPSRPPTPPLLVIKLEEEEEEEGGGASDDEAESEKTEKPGMKEWIPSPYFGEHKHGIKWRRRARNEMVMRASWRRVNEAKGW